MRAVFQPVLLAALAAAASGVGGVGCKHERKRGSGLAARDGGPPVVVVDQPTEGGTVGPLQRETEPNDQRDQAAAVPMPGGVAGTLGRPDDIDFYRIEAGAARQVAVRLRGPAADDGGGDLVLELYDGDGKSLARSDRGPAGALEGLPDAPLAQGAAYYVSVSQFVKKAGKKKKKAAADAGPEGGGPSYQLTIEPIAPGADDELEPNDDPAHAREILLSEEKSGFLGWGKDVDVWKLSLTGFSGGYALDLSVGAVEGLELTVDVLAPDGRVLVSRKGQKDRALLVRGLLPQLGAPFYLARVSGSRSNPEQAYRIRPTSRSLTDTDEAEPDDDVEHAIAAGPLGDGATGERRGFLDGGDTDMYKFDAGREALGFTVAVEPPAGTDVVLRVLGQTGAEIAAADNGKAGQREEIAGLAIGGGQARYVVVTGTGPGDEPDGYILRWSAAVNMPGTPPPGLPPGAPPGAAPGAQAPRPPPGPPPGAQQQPPPDDEPPPVDDPYEGK